MERVENKNYLAINIPKMHKKSVKKITLKFDDKYQCSCYVFKNDDGELEVHTTKMKPTDKRFDSLMRDSIKAINEKIDSNGKDSVSLLVKPREFIFVPLKISKISNDDAKYYVITKYELNGNELILM